MTRIDLDTLTAIEQAASPAPWAYTEHCGAQVCIGLVHDQKHGQVRLAKGGFFLFEIDGSAYYPQLDEEQGEKQALADVKLIASMRNYLPLLLTELRAARAQSSAHSAWAAGYAQGYDDCEKTDCGRADVIQTPNPHPAPESP